MHTFAVLIDCIIYVEWNDCILFNVILMQNNVSDILSAADVIS